GSSVLCARGGAGVGGAGAPKSGRTRRRAVRLFPVLTMRDFPFHTALTIALLGAALVLVGQALSPAKPPTNPSKPVLPKTPLPDGRGSDGRGSAVAPGPPPLLEDSAGALDHFYQALQHTESKEAGAIT